MKIVNEQLWKALQEANPPSEPYGHRILTHAEEWADLMERDMAEGKELETIAKQRSRDADTYGITGFMVRRCRRDLVPGLGTRRAFATLAQSRHADRA